MNRAMNRTIKRVMLSAISLWLLFSAVSSYAQSGGGYDLTWNTIDNGGGTSSHGGYTLDGTIGQLEAGAPISSGGYTLTGGFWAGASIAQYRLYLPIVLRS